MGIRSSLLAASLLCIPATARAIDSEVGVQRWVAGHDYNQPMREQTYRFLNKHFKQVDDPAQAVEPAIQTESVETLATLDRPSPKARPDQAIIDWYRARYTFQSPGPKDAAAWETWRTDLRGRLAALVGDVAVKGRLAGPAESIDFQGGHGLRLRMLSETGLEFPVVLFTPTTEAASPLTLLICDQGIRGVLEARMPLMSALLASKLAVAIAEVGLTGCLKRDWALDSVLLGRPEVGMAITDLRACLDVLSEQRGVDPKRVTLIGLGDSGVTALFAGAVEPRFTHIAAPELGRTYLGGRTSPLVANILRVADLPRLIAATSTRPVLAGRVRTSDFDCAAASYRAMNVESKLEWHHGAVDMKDVAAWTAR